MDRVGAAARTLERQRLVSGRQAAQALSRVSAETDLERACERAALVVESINKDFEAKVALLKRVAASAEHTTMLATNTSSLSISALGRASGIATRLVGTHYWNPPMLMPLVETIPGDDTDPDIVARMVTTLQGLGKEPVVVPDIPGFVSNRLQFSASLLRERSR